MKTTEQQWLGDLTQAGVEAVQVALRDKRAEDAARDWPSDGPVTLTDSEKVNAVVKALMSCDVSATCAGCHLEIAEGMHFMRLRLQLDTRMPDNWQRVRYVEPTFFNLKVHNASCFLVWCIENPIMQDVFAR